MDPSFLPAWRLAELTRGGGIGCLELLDHFLARVARLNPRINAVVVQDADRARARARTLDQGGAREGALFGVPMTVKESFDVAGLATTRGHAATLGHRAALDALPVERLEAAGAVVFGKTNVPVDLADWQSFNPAYGSTCSPWDAARTPGGSSGGSAAALAAGFGGLELGSDIGGSIRVPAHFCGLFGHKPSWGLCASRAPVQAGTGGAPDIAVHGPLARSARDLLVALEAIAGPDPVDNRLRFVLPEPRVGGLRDLRVAVWAGEKGQVTEAETVALIERLADALAAEGATVSRTARPAFDPVAAYHLYLTLLDAAWSGRRTEEVLAGRRDAVSRLAADDRSADAVMLRAVDLAHREWVVLNEQRLIVRRAWGAFFQDWDVLLCPAFGVPALPLMEDRPTSERTLEVDAATVRYNDLLFWPGITCGFHLPASVAPIGLSRGGLPIGVQIAGPFGGDRTTIRVAELLEQSWRGFQAPPGWA